MSGMEGAISCLAWSRDGARVAASTTAGWVAVLDARTWRAQAVRPLHGSGRVAWAPDGRELAVATALLEVRLTDPEDLTERAMLHVGWADDEAGSDGQPAMGVVSDLAYGPGGDYVAFALSDGAVSVLDRARRAELWKRPGDASSPLCGLLSFDPSGRWLALNEGRSVCVIDVATRAERRSRPLPVSVGAVAWSPDGRRIAAEAGDGVVLMDARTLEPTGLIPTGGGGGLRPVWRPDSGGIGVVAGGGFEAWDVGTARRVARVTVVGAETLCATADPTGPRYAYGCADGTLGCVEVG